MNDNPYSSPNASLLSDQPVVTEGAIFKGWIVFILLSTVCGFGAGVIVGGILGGILGAAGMSLQTIQYSCGVAGFLVGMPISYAFFRRSVKKLLAVAS